VTEVKSPACNFSINLGPGEGDGAQFGLGWLWWSDVSLGRARR
jgi:hypothetical protein